MALPVNITELINGRTVEWDRIEFKAGWNPEDIIHTVCAFANDLNNWGGGYIILGIKENDGIPVLPPKGLQQNQLDAIQKKLIELTYQLEPYYIPVTQPIIFQDKNIFIIWVPGGDNRPYRAPATLGKKEQKRLYVRKGSKTVLANVTEEHHLTEMARRIPFDDRINHQADLIALDMNLIREFLYEIKSDLVNDWSGLELEALAMQMRIASGPMEYLKPLNAGLLFFNPDPHQLFRGAQTDLVIYQGYEGRTFTEKTFTGPLHHQIRKVLEFLQTNVIQKKITKQQDEPESLHIVNFPFEAMEEAIVNAFYHRSYEHESPIEINVWPDKIEILSFPGPLPPVDKKMLKKRRIVSRDYRNRRIGDFLKELRLTEGRATGFPTIYSAMERNGSPKPIFETDDEKNYFLTILPVHPSFVEKPEGKLTEKELRILHFCLEPKKRAGLLKELALSNHYRNYTRHIVPLIKTGWLAMTIPNKPNSRNQRYLTTKKGKDILK